MSSCSWKSRGILSVLALASSALASGAERPLPDWAPKPPPRLVEDRLRAEVLLLGTSVETDLRVDEGPLDPGTPLSAEDDLGLDDFRLLPQLELTLLPGERHLVRLSGFALHRSAHRTIDRQIEFDDQVYEPGERVDSTLNLTLFGLTYGNRFLVHERAEITGTIGVQIAAVEANAVVRSRVIREAESGVAPLPLVGLEGRFDFTKRWSTEGRVQYMSANIDDVDGSIIDARLAITWRKNPYLLFGLGYRTFTIEVDSRDEGTPGFVDLNLSGPLLFMRASM
jgi:hypothetical protein